MAAAAVVSEIKPITLRDQIVEEVQQAILEGRLRPGDRIREQALTEQLNVSRTPIREALIVLEQEGLVISYPNRGCFVPHFNEKDIVEIFELRTALESTAGELALKKRNLTGAALAWLENLIEQQRQVIEGKSHDEFALGQKTQQEANLLDRKFHFYLMQLAANERLLRTWRINGAQVTAVLYYHIRAHLQYNHYNMITDHRLILEALLSGDPVQIAEAHRQINERVTEMCIQGLRA